MPEDIDTSLLERLQALRGSSSGASPGRAAAPIKFNVDVIERSKPATREDALAARLKSLRAADDDSAGSPKREKALTATAPQATSSPSSSHPAEAKAVPHAEKPATLENDEDVDLIFSTDDQTLEELLGDVNPDETTPTPAQEPSDEQVRALLEELSRAVPKDDDAGEGDRAEDSDDSDGERMQAKVSDVVAQFQDEAAVDAALRSSKDDDEAASAQEDQDQDQGDGDADIALPSLPPNLDDLSSFSPRRASTTTTTTKADDIDDITARIAALRAPADEEDASFSLPSVPSSRPSAGDKPVRRLTSKTDYTDDDIDGWCTVCLDDATLQCLGCDDDPYCTRCWRDMHIGPAAAFDDRSHKAVQFTRARKKDKQEKVALGA